MARSLLGSFVSGTRQMLAVQLFVSVGAVALAGWTLGVTNEVIRERDRLHERVIQLEQSMAERGITVPSTAAVLEQAAPAPADAYPPSAPPPETTPAEEPKAPPEQTPPSTDGAPNPPPADDRGAENTPPQRPTPDRGTFNPGQVLSELFAPAPPLRSVVLHVRDRADYDIAARMAQELAAASQTQVAVDVMGPGDQRPSGYAYFDGRQNRNAANLVAQFNEIARRSDIAPWSAQLRGVALPALGEYSADRIDIILPPRPAQESLAPQPIDPRRLNLRPPG